MTKYGNGGGEMSLLFDEGIDSIEEDMRHFIVNEESMDYELGFDIVSIAKANEVFFVLFCKMF
ncbi:Hypothetical protein FKW44_016574 [Caligus rogercresseyi]|uniref:Uncharacterized protein n=1 Tax=Caligus rogercresseyi TaxID=217165 RepID=A0A7T8H237_CALRO|nr:Hypothetical protein FKW44_016574 [Caligus rogercresseyi]